MNELDVAIYEALKSAPAVLALLPNGEDDIYGDAAKENAPFPYIVFETVGPGTPRYSFKKREWEEFVIRVKAVTHGKSSKPAKTIAAAVDAVLSDGTFTIPGHTLMYSRKLTDSPPLTEPDGSNRYYHRGGDFEIWVGPAE